jgi:hypothetical protein
MVETNPMKKLITLFFLLYFSFIHAETTTQIEQIKEEKIIVVTTTNFWFANSLHDSKFVIGYNKYEENGLVVYEIILNDNDMAINFLNGKIKIYSDKDLESSK